MTYIKGQWPSKITSGFIRREPSQYGGFLFRDASHGIPILGHVQPSDQIMEHTRVTYHGSYPEQADEISRRLVAAWNAVVGLSTEEVERLAHINARRIENAEERGDSSSAVDGRGREESQREGREDGGR